MIKRLIALISISALLLLPHETLAVENELKHMPEEAKSCFVAAWGETALNEVMAGDREPTEAEKQSGAQCFQGMFSENKKIAVKGDVKACIKKNLGRDLEEIGDLNDADRAKIESCFADARVGVAFPAETKQCIISVVGEGRAQAILDSGEPTEAEKLSIGPKCFGARGPKGAGMDSMPAEAKACVQRIIGAGTTPPSEEQKKQIGAECFGGNAMSEAREGISRMNDTEKTCLATLFGKPIEQMGKLTADQMKQAGERCFKRTVADVTREEGVRRSSDMTDAQKLCVRSRLGVAIEDIGQPNAQQEAVIRECRTSQPATGSGTASAPNPTGVVPESEQPCSGNPLARYKNETQQCVAERIGLTIPTLCQGNFNDPNVNLIVDTCRTNNGE